MSNRIHGRIRPAARWTMHQRIYDMGEFRVNKSISFAQVRIGIPRKPSGCSNMPNDLSKVSRHGQGHRVPRDFGGQHTTGCRGARTQCTCKKNGKRLGGRGLQRHVKSRIGPACRETGEGQVRISHPIGSRGHRVRDHHTYARGHLATLGGGGNQFTQ